MKTKFKLAGIISMLFAVLALMPGKAKAQIAVAQCPYKIVNTLNCPVDVVVEIHTPMPACPICTSFPLNVPPGAAIPFDPCQMGCANPCDIIVFVNAVGGMPFSPPPAANFGTTSPPGNFIGGVGPCSPTGKAFIVYDPAAQTFNIHP